MTYFKGINPGDSVQYMARIGMDRRGRPEFAPRRGKALKLLCFTDHVVVANRGKLPIVVDAWNYLGHRAGRQS